MSRIARDAERLLGASVVAARPLAGGDLSSVFELELAGGERLVAKPGPAAEAEAAMLAAIAGAGAPAPSVVAVGPELLLMERLPSGGRLVGAWSDLATVLNQLHGRRADRFGWDTDHRFGAVTVRNGWSDDWPAFWAERRLRCHLPHVDTELGRRIERLAGDLSGRLPAHPPASLLHGDLWGGNILVEDTRVSGLIDPACYHGDREVDAAMLTLFDHPPPGFFDALGLEPGWRERQSIYRLWPLLVHLRLFGRGYAGSVAEALAALGV
ncbi:fructosamine kinase family protein [Sphingomonas sp.]|uniref:fructosamine kinase family protein n=1 Tax=Sphingomonas sp. TaxID=28214 RepID=UPI0025DCDB33|nr:fructosamine kinase family protein [Sphingomonas sp.]